jgi:hypothetical protein
LMSKVSELNFHSSFEEIVFHWIMLYLRQRLLSHRPMVCVMIVFQIATCGYTITLCDENLDL